MAEEPPSYHDLYVTTIDIPRTSIFNLGYGVEISCNRVGGWSVWVDSHGPGECLLGGEYEGPGKGLRLDVGGHVIVDSLSTQDTPS